MSLYDVSASELATYYLHALTPASTLPSKAAVRRFVRMPLAALVTRQERT